MPMPITVHAHGFWVGMGAILLFMGFKNIDTSPLDSNIDRQNNILTKPEDIASEI